MGKAGSDTVRRPGDKSYNARRREYRAAQRYMKQAQRTSGATAQKNLALARAHLENAIATYDPTQAQRISSPIQNLAAQFGMTTDDIRKTYQLNTETDTVQRQKQLEKQRQKAISESKSALASVDEDVRRQQEAKILLDNPNISKRVFGGLVGIWKDKVKSGVSADENRKAITEAVFDYFHTDNWAEILDKLENKLGNGLFDISADDEIYDSVRIAMQLGIKQNILVA